MTTLLRPRLVAAIAIAAGLVGAASAAQAHTDVFFSLGVPVATPAPVYVQPQPVYVQPQSVYVAPQPVYVAPPARVVVRPGWSREDWRRAEWRRHHEHERVHGRHWN